VAGKRIADAGKGDWNGERDENRRCMTPFAFPTESCRSELLRLESLTTMAAKTRMDLSIHYSNRLSLQPCKYVFHRMTIKGFVDASGHIVYMRRRSEEHT